MAASKFLGTFKYTPSEEDKRFLEETKGMTRAEKDRWGSLPPSQRDRLRKEGFLKTGAKVPSVDKSAAWQTKQNRTFPDGTIQYREQQGVGPWITVTEEQKAEQKRIPQLPSQTVISEEEKKRQVKSQPVGTPVKLKPTQKVAAKPTPKAATSTTSVVRKTAPPKPAASKPVSQPVKKGPIPSAPTRRPVPRPAAPKVKIKPKRPVSTTKVKLLSPVRRLRR